jgi:uncharacterized repeat protein (TIGR01451 family)
MPDITGDGVNDLDITPAGSSTTIGGVIFTDAVNTGSGTGNYNTFLAISDNDGVEEGFNSDDTPPIDASNKDIDQAKTHTVKLSSLVVVTIGGVQYYEFRVDLNEANSDPNAQISLDQFKLYTSTNGGIVDTTTLFSQNLIYDMDAGGNVSVLLSDAESSGSGTDDYAVLVPVSEFAGLDPTTTYVYLYTQMGAAGTNWNATATFEEWNLQNGVTLTGTKFEDLNNNGVKDAGEGPIEGVTIFIDANKNGTLDAGERTTLTDANGNYSFFGVATGQTVWIDEVVPAGATQTTGAHEEVIIASNAAAGSTVVVDPIGNFLPHPAISITKAVHDVDGDTTTPVVDAAGDIVNYTIDISNTGNVTLTGLLTEDQVEALSGTSLEPVVSGGFNTGDTNTNGAFDPGETWHFTAAYTVTQDDIDNNGGGNGILSNIARATTNQTSEVTDDADVPIELNPAIAIEKTAVLDDGGDCVDQDGDIIRYTYSVTNAGNVALDNVVVVDDKVTVVADDADIDGFNDGDTDEDGLLDVNETWTYSASYTATQDDIDNAGDGDGFIHNNVTANGDAAVSGEAALEATDEADVEVCQLPAIDLEKFVMTDVSGVFADADDPDGSEASTSSTVNFKVVLTNTGNVTLTDITLSDSVVHTVGGVPGAPVAIDYSDPSLNAFIDLDGDATLDSGEEWANFDTNSDGTLDVDENSDPFELSVGETVSIYYSLTSLLGQHENTAVVTAQAATTGDSATDEDDANYYVLATDDCVGVRTPGFWANSKWGTFWDATGDGWGTAANEPKQAGTPGFADGELLYKVYLTDTNSDGFVNSSDAFSTGLLIGDYNMNGITDAGEDTIFISLANAKTLINASSKQLVDGKTADGIYMLGRDMVATWLNYLANNQDTTGECIGDVSGATNTPREYLDAAIDWMQQFASTTNGTAAQNLVSSYHDGNGQSVFQFDARVAPSSASWQNIVTQGEDLPVSAAQMHSQLDAYNNTGAINGIEYCCDADSSIALHAISLI